MKMKARAIIPTCCTALLCCAASVTVHAQNRVDITLEGPWILFQDPSFKLTNDATSKTVPVLIAMVPDVTDNNDDEAFHSMAIVAGDGFFVEKPNVYCITFDLKCAQNIVASQKKLLSQDGYAQPIPLSVHAGTGWWSMYQKAYKNGGKVTAFILPMPDSYSNDGVYQMRFAPKFDVDGNGYDTKVKASIGVQLHYRKGPTSFDLVSCTLPTATSCNAPAALKVDHTKLKNTGTLRIMMRAPAINNACDNHVRKAHPKLIKLLDSDKNSNLAFIDPARYIDAHDNAHYDEIYGWSCLKNDPQQHDDQGNRTSVSSLGSEPMSGTNHSLATQLGAIVSDFNNLPLSAYHGLTDDDKKSLKLEAVNAVNDPEKFEPLDPDFPRISQVTRIQDLLRISEQGVVRLSAKVAAQLTADRLNSQLTAQFLEQQTLELDIHPLDSDVSPGATNLDPLDTLLSELEKIKKLIEKFLKAPTKNGADCLAAVMKVEETSGP
jgi:hypothetical protein